MRTVVKHRKWGERKFFIAEGMRCPECNDYDFRVEVTDFGDVEVVCGFCETELVHLPCAMLLQIKPIDNKIEISCATDNS
jgi:Zn ribbon nucleic-acid-binding protein